MSVKTTLSVSSLSGTYPISIGSDLICDPSLFSAEVSSRQVCIISHPQVAEHYLHKMIDTCRLAGASEVTSWLFPAGESCKTLATAEKIWTFLLEQQFDRGTILIALGGGVVGDLVGFCAACYLRGVRIIQCPTTLLAQIDASVGGKTGLNHALGKNLIGAFHAPRAVIIDIKTLKTLAQNEFIGALSELIKYAMIADKAFFIWLEEHIDALVAREEEALFYAIEKACSLKAKVVSEDEKENANRALLNFGHTIGHAIESLLNYEKWSHGEAISVGMVVATHLSWQQQRVEKTVLERLIALFQRVNLPIHLPKGITVSLILAKIKQDKKHAHGKLRWVLLSALGEAHLDSAVTQEQITQALLFCSAA